MHYPEERLRLRWRMLLWLIFGVILLPLLYVASAGPAAWWSRHHYHSPAWMDVHAASLKVLYQHPQTRAALDQYMRWWFNVPASRSWRRQFLVDQLADRRQTAADLRAAQAQLEAEVESLHTRLDALHAQAISPQELPVEAIGIRLQLEQIELRRGRLGSHLSPAILEQSSLAEFLVRHAEDQLREFDAQ